MIHNRNEMDESFSQDPPEECYKVVLPLRKHFTSITSTIGRFSKSVIYVPLERTVPQIGKLLAFGSLEAAKSYRHDNYAGDGQIWLAHGENLKPVTHILLWGAIDDETVRMFWKMYGDQEVISYPYLIPLTIAPWGTISSDSITLVKWIA